jgi:hypothetical protein
MSAGILVMASSSRNANSSESPAPLSSLVPTSGPSVPAMGATAITASFPVASTQGGGGTGGAVPRPGAAATGPGAPMVHAGGPPSLPIHLYVIPNGDRVGVLVVGPASALLWPPHDSFLASDRLAMHTLIEVHDATAGVVRLYGALPLAEAHGSIYVFVATSSHLILRRSLVGMLPPSLAAAAAAAPPPPPPPPPLPAQLPSAGLPATMTPNPWLAHAGGSTRVGSGVVGSPPPSGPGRLHPSSLPSSVSASASPVFAGGSSFGSPLMTDSAPTSGASTFDPRRSATEGALMGIRQGPPSRTTPASAHNTGRGMPRSVSEPHAGPFSPHRRHAAVRGTHGPT